MKRGKKTISLILSLLVSLGYGFGGYAGTVAYADDNTGAGESAASYQGTDVSSEITKDEVQKYLKEQIDEKSYVENDIPKLDEDVWIIVQTNKPSLIKQMEDKKISTSVSEFVQSDEGQALSNDLIDEQSAVKAEIAANGIKAEYKENYTAVLNGFAAKVKYGEVSKIKALSGVKDVTLSAIYEKEDTVYSDETEAKAYEEALTKEGCQYTGAGITIAVLDTGVDWKHSAFQNMPYKQSITKADVDAVLSKTYAYYQMNGEVSADDLYHNGKVPFGFDYADGDIDVIPSETAVEKYGNDHGTHVSGIAAGNDNEITGVAPDAQILAMKVFSDSSSGAATQDILGGLNDAVLLGADVINMSLGSSAGFSSEDSDSLVGQIYQAVYEAGIDLVCSAGNAYSGGYSGPNGDLQSTSNPDTGIVSSSGSYNTSMATASIDATNALYLTVDGNTVRYENLSGHSFFNELGKDSCEYVMVPGIGEEADYDGLDVEGKIAVVKRGGCTFEEKELMAASKGAAGCIIYNNKVGYLISMSIDNVVIPTISITYDDGKLLENAENKTIAKDTAEGQKLMSDFSSWGPLPDLKLKPEITAPGGDIYSSLPYQKYGYMSGTSMASPWMAGATASVEQYIRTTNPDLSKKESAVMAYRLLMSTATQAEDADGNLYSPRKQGAGVASVTDAVNTDAYLYVYGQDKTKLELGDDKDETGVYTLSFHVKNMSMSSLSYDVSASVMTETVGSNNTIAQKSYPLDDAKVELVSVANGAADGTVVTVGGNADATVTVKITLTDEDKAYMKSNFENGIYVEGFVNLKAQEEKSVDLSVPYLAFFGDWTKAPLMDSNMYDDEDPTMVDSYAIGELGYFSSIRLGTYVFKSAEGQEVPPTDVNRIAVGLRNGSGVGSLSKTALGLLRGAKTVTTELRDKATGRLIDSSTTLNAKKSAYNSSYGGILPTSVGRAYPDGLYDTSYEKSNTELVYTINASMDYKDPKNTANTSWTYPVYVDYESPILQNSDSIIPYAKDGRIYIDCEFTDNHYLMAAGVYSVGVKYDYMGRPSETPGDLYGDYLTPINDAVPYKTSKVTFDITDYIDQFKDGKFYILAYDYALNQATYKFQQQVVNPDKIELSQNEATMKINELLKLDAKVLPEDASNKDVTWTSSNESVAVVKDGEVSAIAAGTAVIKAASVKGSASAECSVTVTSDVADPVKAEKVTLDKESVTVAEGKTAVVQADIEPWYTTDKSIAWSSSDETVAKVQDGEITGVKAGEAVITATAAGGAKAELPVKVIESQPAFTISNNVLIAYNGDDENVVIPDGVTEISQKAFYNNTTMKTVTIPDSVKKIGDYALSQCEALTTVNMPKGLDELGEHVFYYSDKLQSIVVPEGIKELKQYSFAGCESLVSAKLPSTLKVIDNEAFYGCESLETVNLPEGFEEFAEGNSGSYAFQNCYALKSIVLPKSLKVIGSRTFINCKSLTSINLENIEEIKQSGLQGCGFTEITIPENVKVLGYASVSNMYNLTSITVEGNPETDAYVFNGNKALVSFTAPELTAINKCMFYGCSSMTSFTLPSKVKTIGDGAFKSCSKLAEFIIPKDSVFTGIDGSIGTDVFYSCSKLAKFTVEEGNPYLKSDSTGILYTADGKTMVAVPYAITGISSLTIPEGVENICDNAFKSKSISSISLPSTLKTIGAYAFYNSFKGTKLTIPDSVESIGDYAFYGCTSLTDLSLGKGIKTIGDYSFNCSSNTKAKSLVIPDSVVSIGQRAFYQWKAVTSLTLGNSVETIGDYAFYRMAALTDLVIPDSVKTIGTRAFNQCEQLKNVDFGNSVQSIGNEAFRDCWRLQSIDLPDSVTSLGDYAFAYDHSLTSVKLSSSLESLPKYLFYNMNKNASTYGCTSPVKSIVIPASVKSIDVSAFKDCPYLEKIIIEDGNTVYGGTPEGGYYDLETGTLMFWPMGNSAEEVTIPEGVKVLTDYLFDGNYKIKKINLPSTLEVIGKYSLSDANIEEVNFAPLKGGLTVGNYAFAYDDYLKNIEFPYGTISLGEAACRDCESLESVVLPDSVETLGNSVFFRSEALKSVKLSNRLTEIPKEAFHQCTSLEKIEIPASVSYIEFTAIYTPFQDCDSLTEITVAEGSKYYKSVDGVLYDKLGTELEVYPNAKLDESFSIPEGVKRIQTNAFRGNMNLKSVVLPSTLERIGDCAFKECYNLADYEFRSIEAPLLEVRLFFESYNLSWYGNFYDYYFDIPINQPPVYTDINLNMTYPEGATGYDGYVWDIFFKNKENAGLDNVFKVNNLTSSLDDKLKVTLTWDSAPWAEEYRVERAEQTENSVTATDTITNEDVQVNAGIMGEYTALDTIKGTSFVDSTAEVGKTYSYKVTPLKDSGASEGIAATTALYINPHDKSQSDALVVITLIDQISDPVTLDDEGIIKAARKAYDALSDDSKSLVYNSQKLEDAEKALAELKSKAAAEAVEELIKAIPSPVALEDEEAIKAAREAYDALTEEQKALVSNYDKLADAEKALAELKAKAEDDKAAAEAVEELIKAIPSPVAIEDEEAIKAAREAYDALTEEQKALVSNYDKLVDAEKALAELKAKAEDDKAAAEAVEELIKAIPSPVTLEDEAAIKAAREAYDALTEEQKALVSNYDKLADAEKTLAELKAKAEDDKAAAEAVEELIKAIPSPVTLEDEGAVKSARDAYDALTEEQKALVSNYDKLADAEKTLAELKAHEVIKTEIIRLFGDTRYTTAVKVSQEGWKSSRYAVLASGMSYVDSLVAAPLASVYDAPVLLTETGKLTEATEKELDRLGVTDVFIAGGTGVVSSEVEKALTAKGIAVVRFAGTDRYDTSIKIAKYIDRVTGNVTKAYVVGGLAEADATSIASKAAEEKQPILLVQKDAVPDATLAWLNDKKLDTAYVIGGEGVVSNAVLDSINKVTAQDISSNRLSGSDRYATNAAVVKSLYSDYADAVVVAKGLPVIDALVAAPFAAKYDAPVILVNDELTEEQKAVIDGMKSPKLVKVGGQVSEDIVTEMADLLSK